MTVDNVQIVIQFQPSNTKLTYTSRHLNRYSLANFSQNITSCTNTAFHIQNDMGLGLIRELGTEASHQTIANIAERSSSWTRTIHYTCLVREFDRKSDDVLRNVARNFNNTCSLLHDVIYTCKYETAIKCKVYMMQN